MTAMKLMLAAAVLFTWPVAARAQQEPATVILVRHAEKAAEPADDPPLSDAGKTRVQALLKALRTSGVDVVYHSNRVRTRETGRVIADSLNAALVEVPLQTPIAKWVDDVVQRVRTQGGGRVSLIVGHSNTFAPVIQAFGGPVIEEIVDQRYDDMFVLTVQDGRALRMIRVKYGARWQ